MKAATFYIYIYTSGKNFIKITGVGMGAAKSNETSRNGNVGEFRHMTIYFIFFQNLACRLGPL